MGTLRPVACYVARPTTKENAVHEERRWDNGVRNRFADNADNQLTGPGTYVYDGNGNPTTWSGTSLTFDVENRMTAYGTTLTAGYRGDGLRAWKNTASGQTYFLYDGISVVCELDAGGNVIAGSTYGAAGLLSRGSVQYQFDNLGDATIRLDGSGNVLSYRLFDAWGNELSSGSEPYGYRARYGYYADGETGLLLLAHRYYYPAEGRFLIADPWLLAGPGMYAYVAANPVAYIDPTGMALKPGSGPPGKWLEPPSRLDGRQVEYRWNKKGFYEYKRGGGGGGGEGIHYDNRSHGTGVDRGSGPQSPHWDEQMPKGQTGGRRFDLEGNQLPGSGRGSDSSHFSLEPAFEPEAVLVVGGAALAAAVLAYFLCPPAVLAFAVL